MAKWKKKNNKVIFNAEDNYTAPEKSFQMVRYGWYSNKSRGMRLKKGIVRPGDKPLENDAEVEIIDVSEYEPKRIPSKTWRECIKTCAELDSVMAGRNLPAGRQV